MGGDVAVLATRMDALRLADTTAVNSFTCENTQATPKDTESKRTVSGPAAEPLMATASRRESLSDDLTSDITWGDGCFHEKGAVTGSDTTLFAVHFENSSVNDLSLNNCKFIDVIFRNCNLSNVKIRDTFFENVTLEDSDLDDLIWVCGCWQDKTVTGLNISKETLGVGDPIPEQILDPNWVKDKHTYKPQLVYTNCGDDTNTSRAAPPQVNAPSQFEKDRYDGKLGPFRFLDLGKNKAKGEDDPSIRNKIYSYLLASEALEIIDASSLMLSTPNNGLVQQSTYLIEDTYWHGKPQVRAATYFARSSLFQGLSTGIYTSILYANKQIHKEATAILYGQNITFAGSAEGALAWLKDISEHKNLIRSITFQYRFIQQTECLENLDYLTIPSTKKSSFQKLCGLVVRMIEESYGFQRFNLVVKDKKFWDLPNPEEDLRGIANVIPVVTAFYRRDKIDQMGQIHGVNLDILSDTPLWKEQSDFIKLLEDGILSEAIEEARRDDKQR